MPNSDPTDNRKIFNEFRDYFAGHYDANQEDMEKFFKQSFEFATELVKEGKGKRSSPQVGVIGGIAFYAAHAKTHPFSAMPSGGIHDSQI